MRLGVRFSPGAPLPCSLIILDLRSLAPLGISPADSRFAPARKNTAQARFSGRALARERVLNSDTRNHLSGFHVFGKNPGRSRFCRRRHNESVPKADPGLILNPKCRCDFRRRRFNAPDRVTARHRSRQIPGSRRPNLASHIDVELLEHLHTKTPVRPLHNLERMCLATSCFDFASTS